MKKSILLGAFALFLSSGSVFAEEKGNTLCATDRNPGKEVGGAPSQPKEEGTSSNVQGEQTKQEKDN